MLLPPACEYLESVVVYQVIAFLCHNFPVVVLFSLLKMFVVQHKDLHQWWSSQPRGSNSVLSSFPEGHLQLLPWSHFVSRSISVLCAITGCRIQFLKLASLKRPLWKAKHFNDHVYPLSRLLYNNFGFSFVDIQERCSENPKNRSSKFFLFWKLFSNSYYSLGAFFMVPSKHCPIIWNGIW